MIGFFIAYLVGAFMNLFFSILVFSLYNDGTQDDKEARRKIAPVILATPIWPLYWAQWVFKIIAHAIATVAEEKEETK